MIFVSIRLQDAPLIEYVFQNDDPAAFIKTIGYDEEKAIITNNTGSTIKLDTIGSMNALIDDLCREASVKKGARFAQDGLSHIIRDAVNHMDNEYYDVWLKYLLVSADKDELMGYSNHAVQILIKE